MLKEIKEFFDNHSEGEDAASEELRELVMEYPGGEAEKNFKLIETELSYHEDGYTYYDVILKHLATGKFFRGTYSYHSWDDGDGPDFNDFEEVFAVERMTTFYETKKEIEEKEKVNV